LYHVIGGQILGRHCNWVKVLRGFLLALPFTVTSSNGFYSPPTPPSPNPPGKNVVLNLVCDVNIYCFRKAQVSEPSRLRPETSTKLYVREFGFRSLSKSPNIGGLDLQLYFQYQQQLFLAHWQKYVFLVYEEILKQLGEKSHMRNAFYI
jgi:hypothetical protein